MTHAVLVGEVVVGHLGVLRAGGGQGVIVAGRARPCAVVVRRRRVLHVGVA